MRRLLCLLILTSGITAWANSPLLIVDNQLIASPALPGSAASQLTTGASGDVYLSWIETAPSDRKLLRVSSFDATTKRWSPPSTVVEHSDLILNASSTPQIAVNGKGELVVAWYLINDDSRAEAHPTYHGMVSRSSDQGKTWSTPIRLTQESVVNEFLSLTALSDGRFLAVWLDGRERHGAAHGHAHDHAAPSDQSQTLRSRILFSDAPDMLVDPRVCDCCPTSVTGFADGSALVVYRDRLKDEIRDISSARFQNGAWSAPKRLSHDDWKIAGCPVNGPALSSSGTRVSAAWFTAANGEARVFSSASSTAGELFFAPARIDDGKPAGYVDVVQARDGTRFVSWVESTGDSTAEGKIELRRISADQSLSVPVELAKISRKRLSGIPRLTVLKDADGVSTQLMLAYTEMSGDISHLATRLLTIAAPEPNRSPCASCPPEEERGSPVHGYIRSVDTMSGRVSLKHDDIPGVMPAMTMKFRVVPDELTKLAPNTEIFGRIERREDGWWLFGIRTVVRPN